MAAGYGAPADASGAELLPWSQAAEQLEGAHNYWLCTTRADGRPHAAPLWGLWLDDAFWFSTDAASVKGRNMARDPRIVIHLESGADTVVLEGEVARGVADERYAGAYEAKYGWEVEPGSPVYVLRPRVVQTWSEKGFPRDATRWVFD